MRTVVFHRRFRREVSDPPKKTPIVENEHSPRFAGHETFTLRYGWLKKSMDAVFEDPEVFTCDDVLTTLGVGKNTVRSIRHGALATGIIQEDYMLYALRHKK